jgi:hypothetical protein
MADNDRFDDDSLEDPVPTLRPQRPAPIELAAAILIVSGVLGLVGAIGAASGLPAGTEQLLVITAAMNVGSAAIGILVRFGRAWIVAVNYVAVLGFLDLLGAGGSGLALMLGVADIVVFVLLFVHKPWFDAVRRDAQRRAAERRIAGPPVGGG